MNAKLHIQVAVKKTCSFLKHVFFTTPFKVMDITEDKAAGPLYLMLMSASPGVLDGDVYEIKIEVERNAVLYLHTQAYQRIFYMKQGASQQMTVHVKEGAAFIYLPHPAVPHQQSVFTGINNFYLHINACLVFGEVLTCGRKLNGESFLFSKYHSITQVFINEALVIKENLLMQPALIEVSAIGQLEGFTHQASLLILDEHLDCKNLQSLILELLAEKINIESGVTAAPVNGLIIRLLGNGAEELYDVLKQMAGLVKPVTQKKIYHAT